MDIQDIIRLSRSLYNLYNPEIWEQTVFFEESGGYVVTARARIAFSEKNKTERMKFEKEQRIVKNFAYFGFQIEHLAEYSGVSSPDVRIAGNSHGIARVNGKYADLKSTGSSNNIENYAKKAINEQGAELVLFEFTAKNAKIESEITKLSRKGIHGFYYYTGIRRCYEF